MYRIDHYQKVDQVELSKHYSYQSITRCQFYATTELYQYLHPMPMGAAGSIYENSWIRVAFTGFVKPLIEL